MKKVKRIISLLLTLALVIGLAPSVSFAGESSQRNTYSFSYYAFNRIFSTRILVTVRLWRLIPRLKRI